MQFQEVRVLMMLSGIVSIPNNLLIEIKKATY